MRGASQSRLSVRERGLVVAALLLPMPLAHGSLSIPLFGSAERRENAPVTLSAAPGAAATVAAAGHRGRHAPGQTKAVLDEVMGAATVVADATTSYETAGNGDGSGEPPAEGDPGRVGGGGSGTGSPGEPPGTAPDPGTEPTDADVDPPAPSAPPATAPAVDAAAEKDPGPDRAVTVAADAAATVVEIAVTEHGVGVDIAGQEEAPPALDVTLNDGALLP